MNNYLDDIKFQYYPASVYHTTPSGACSLRQMLYGIKNPKSETVEIFKQIEQASLDGDKKLKDKLKAQTVYFTPCIVSDGKGRKYENIVRWTGILLVDIDNLEPEIAKALKQYLFDTYDFVIASFLSVSKRGVKVLIRIPQVSSVEDFKSYFYGLMVNWQWIEGMDLAPQNCSLPAYLTYDYDLLMREDASVFSNRGMKIDELKVYSGEDIEVDATEEDRETIKRLIKSAFDKITDSGHYICRSSCIVGWGYCAAGYFTEEEMEEYLFELIDDNDYLSTKSKAYKKTCLDMKKVGMASPLTLQDNE